MSHQEPKLGPELQLGPWNNHNKRYFSHFAYRSWKWVNDLVRLSITPIYTYVCLIHKSNLVMLLHVQYKTTWKHIAYREGTLLHVFFSTPLALWFTSKGRQLSLSLSELTSRHQQVWYLVWTFAVSSRWPWGSRRSRVHWLRISCCSKPVSAGLYSSTEDQSVSDQLPSILLHTYLYAAASAKSLGLKSNGL